MFFHLSVKIPKTSPTCQIHSSRPNQFQGFFPPRCECALFEPSIDEKKRQNVKWIWKTRKRIDVNFGNCRVRKPNLPTFLEYSKRSTCLSNFTTYMCVVRKENLPATSPHWVIIPVAHRMVIRNISITDDHFDMVDSGEISRPRLRSRLHERMHTNMACEKNLATRYLDYVPDWREINTKIFAYRRMLALLP